MVKKLELTEDILKLISNIHFKDYGESDGEKFFIDLYGLYGGSYVFEDISYLLGRYDEHIAGTEDLPTGPRFEQEFEDYMWSIHSFIVDNLDSVEELVHWFSNKGGLKVGTYKKGNDGIWKYVEQE